MELLEISMLVGELCYIVLAWLIFFYIFTHLSDIWFFATLATNIIFLFLRWAFMCGTVSSYVQFTYNGKEYYIEIG